MNPAVQGGGAELGRPQGHALAGWQIQHEGKIRATAVRVEHHQALRRMT